MMVKKDKHKYCQTFNRTIVELKYNEKITNRIALIAFNRTIVELKFENFLVLWA